MRHVVATEIAADPFVRRSYRDHLRYMGVVNTLPTEKGDKNIDFFHADAVLFLFICFHHPSHIPAQNVKRIINKPFSKFASSCHFLEMLTAEKRGHINVALSDSSNNDYILSRVLNKDMFYIDAHDRISTVFFSCVLVSFSIFSSRIFSF